MSERLIDLGMEIYPYGYRGNQYWEIADTGYRDICMDRHFRAETLLSALIKAEAYKKIRATPPKQATVEDINNGIA